MIIDVVEKSNNEPPSLDDSGTTIWQCSTEQEDFQSKLHPLVDPIQGSLLEEMLSSTSFEIGQWYIWSDFLVLLNELTEIESSVEVEIMIGSRHTQIGKKTVFVEQQIGIRKVIQGLKEFVSLASDSSMYVWVRIQ